MPVKVSEIIRVMERDGWVPLAQRDSHRPFKHPVKPGRAVTGRSSSLRPQGRFPAHRVPGSLDERPAIQDLCARIAPDAARDNLMADDILTEREGGRSRVVITERKDHRDALADRLAKFAKNVAVLRGGMRARDVPAATEALASSAGEEA